MGSTALCILIIVTGFTLQTLTAQPLKQHGLLTSDQAVADSDSLRRDFESTQNRAVSPHQRPLMPGTATLVAIFPGILFHGVGHFYARDAKTGFVLLGIDLVSKGVWFFESLKGLSEGFREPSEAVLWTCVSVNAAAWLYDIGHAGVAASNHNSRYQFSLRSHEGVPIVVFSVNIGQ